MSRYDDLKALELEVLDVNPVGWRNNETRLNQSNLNTISEGLEKLRDVLATGTKVNGEPNTTGLITTVDKLKAFVQGDNDTTTATGEPLTDLSTQIKNINRALFGGETTDRPDLQDMTNEETNYIGTSGLLSKMYNYQSSNANDMTLLHALASITYVSASQIKPKENKSVDLGSSQNAFNTIYVKKGDTTINISDSISQLENYTNILDDYNVTSATPSISTITVGDRIFQTNTTATTIQNVEVGSQGFGGATSPTYSSVFDAGALKYHPYDTGVQPTSTTTILYDNGSIVNMLSEDSGSLTFTHVFLDSQEWTLVVQYDHSACDTAQSKLGKDMTRNDYPDRLIAPGMVRHDIIFKPYRKSFYGTTSEKPAQITSEIIRGLQNSSTKALENGSTFDIVANAGAKRIIFAYPNTLRNAKSVIDVDGLSMNIISSFSRVLVNVADYRGGTFNPMKYKCFYLDLAEPLSKDTTFRVVI